MNEAIRQDRRPCRTAGVLAIGMALIAGGVVPIDAATLRVPTQVADLAEGLAQATAGDTLLVGAGRYVGSFTVPSGVALIATAGPDSTILDGGGAGRVLRFEECDESTLLQGFTVTGGVVSGKRDAGAGILCDQHAVPRLNGNVVIGNRATGADGRGGGIACLNGSDAVIANNRIEDNEAAWGGGLFVGKQGGWISSPTIMANRIVRNRARRGGGGVAITHASEPVLISNVIAWNVALGDGGGGVHVARGLPVIEENTIWANVDSSGIAAALCMTDYAAPRITNNIIAGHSGAPAVRCADLDYERQDMRCNDVWNPGGGDFAAGCAVQPGNISIDPGFCDAEHGNFGLRPSSPCLRPAECGQIGASGVACQE